MKEDEKKEALENIEYIKELITQSQKDIRYSGGGWISIIWGIFCFVGLIGQRLLMLMGPSSGPYIGLWWIILIIFGILATYGVIKKRIKSPAKRKKSNTIKYFLSFWIPLIILACVFAQFCVFSPQVSKNYIPIVVMLVISTGYIIIGLLMFKEILFMGIIGFIGTIFTGIYFLKYSDIIISLLFGVGLIITGLIINRRWKE